MITKKILIVLSLTSVLKLECASKLMLEAIGDGVTRMSMGLKTAHPEMLKAAKNLLSSKPITNSDNTLLGKRKHTELPSMTSDSGPFFSSYKSAFFVKSTNKKFPLVKKITELAGLNNFPSSLVYQQHPLGSCTANSMAFIIRYLSVRNSDKLNDFSSDNTQMLNPSRLYHYYNTRYEEGNINKDPSNVLGDHGASMEGAMVALDKYGTGPEDFSDKVDLERGFTYSGWSYDPDNGPNGKFKIQPVPESYRFALDPSLDGINTDSGINPYSVVSQKIRYADLCLKYQGDKLNTPNGKISLVNDFKTALSRNNPIYFGTALEQAFMLPKDGFIPMPDMSNFKPIGGHALAIVGHGNYNPTDAGNNYFKFINSWGPEWGDNGFGYFPEEYVSNVNFFGSSAYAVDLLK